MKHFATDMDKKPPGMFRLSPSASGILLRAKGSRLHGVA